MNDLINEMISDCSAIGRRPGSLVTCAVVCVVEHWYPAAGPEQDCNVPLRHQRRGQPDHVGQCYQQEVLHQ